MYTVGDRWRMCASCGDTIGDVDEGVVSALPDNADMPLGTLVEETDLDL